MHQKQSEPLSCPHHGATVVTEIAFVQKNPDGTRVFLCRVHAELVAACGIMLDTYKKRHSETRHRALAAGLSDWERRSKGVVDHPSSWTHEAKRPGRHRKIAQGSWVVGRLGKVR